MKRTTLIITYICFFTYIFASANNPSECSSGQDIHFKTALDKISKTNIHFASTFTQSCEILDGDREFIGRTITLNEYRKTDDFDGYIETSKSKEGDPKILIKMDVGIPSDPSSVFDDFDLWEKQPSYSEDESIEIWEGRSSVMTDQKAIMWISKESNTVIESEFHFSHRYMLKKYDFVLNIKYLKDSSLPVSSVLSTKTRKMFAARHLILKTDYGKWSHF